MHDTTAQLRGHACRISEYSSGGMHAVLLQHCKMSCFDMQISPYPYDAGPLGQVCFTYKMHNSMPEGIVPASVAEGLHVPTMLVLLYL